MHRPFGQDAVPAGLAAAAAERVGGVASNPGDGVVERVGDGIDPASIVKVVQKLQAPPPDLGVGVAQPGNDRVEHGLGDGDGPKFAGVDAADKGAHGVEPLRGAELLHKVARIHGSKGRAARRFEPSDLDLGLLPPW